MLQIPSYLLVISKAMWLIFISIQFMIFPILQMEA